MVDTAVLRVALSALLLAALAYALVRSAASRSRSARVDFGLQSIMSGAMLAMLSGAAWCVLPTVALSSAATWWFAIRASAHPTSVAAGCAGLLGRGDCVFHGTMMAATALMAGSMLTAGTLESGARSLQAAGTSPVTADVAAHGHGTGVGFGAWGAGPGAWTLDPLLLGVVIVVAAAGWRAALLIRSFGGTRDGTAAAVRRRRLGRADLGADVVGAAAMAMMFVAHVSG